MGNINFNIKGIISKGSKKIKCKLLTNITATDGRVLPSHNKKTLLCPLNTHNEIIRYKIGKIFRSVKRFHGLDHASIQRP